jgi:hypothetical protein
MISPLVICRTSARNEANEDASKLSFFETKGAEKMLFFFKLENFRSITYEQEVLRVH